MEPLLYLFKATAILSLFYLLYTLLLKQETFFKTNRHYLVLGILASFITPLLILKRTIYKPMPAMDFDLLANANYTTTVGEEVAPAFTFWEVAFAIYLLGVLIMLGSFILKLSKVVFFLRNAKKTSAGGHQFIQINGLDAPFSFFNTIVIDARAHDLEELEMILLHEQAHAKQYHSLDVLLIQLTLILQWFNPLAWLYKSAIVENLEYLADAATASQVTNHKQYQLALVKVAAPKWAPALTNSFYQSFIKKRIVMLNKQSSSEFKKWKILLIVPVLGAFMWSFNVKEEVKYLTEETVLSASSTPVMYISPSSNDADLAAIESYFNTEIDDVDVQITNVKRNTQAQLTGFAIATRFKGQADFKRTLELNKQDDRGNPFKYAISYDKQEIIIVDVNDGQHKTVIAKDGVKGYTLSPQVKNSLTTTGKQNTLNLPEIIEDAPEPAPQKKQKASAKPFKKIITPTTTESEIEAIAKALDAEYDVAMQFSRLKYNDAGEISRIKIEIQDRETGNKASASYNRDGNAIEPIAVYRSAEGTFGVVSGQNSIVQRSAMTAEALAERKEEMQARIKEMEARREEMQARFSDSTERRTEMKARMEERRVAMQERMEARKAEMKEREEAMRSKMRARMNFKEDSVFMDKERVINASEFKNATNRNSQNIYYRVRQPQKVSNVIYVIDGKVMDEEDFDFKSIDVKIIDSINILKGDAPFKKYKSYVDEETEGVIEIFTKQKEK
ncbi:M56 family metallopeptidase [Leeuwenhoekiella palythoae]|uniref:M56 family metallopeptidase n=1 Tax=Leeuwenhoekiella palythoae TaxID=573501 RepID=UPI0035120529